MKPKFRIELGGLNLALVAGAAALLTVLSGCGGAYEAKQKSAVQKLRQKAALELSPRILPANPQDFTIPARVENSTAGSGVVADRDRLVFSEVVAVPETDGEEPPLFLVWDENALGIRISDAYFNLKKRDAYNRTYGGEERQNAYRDPETGRWFVPLLTIIGGKPENADPSQLYWVRLELHLEDGKQVEVSVGMRVRGPVPVIHAEALSLSPLGLNDPSTLGAKIANEGVVVSAEDYSNPAARPLAIWVKAQAELGLETALSTSRFTSDGRVRDNRKIKIVETREHSQSTAGLELRTLRVTRNFGGDGDPIEERLALDRWQKIILGPFERIRLEWIAEVKAGTPHCALPADTVRKFKWEVKRCRKIAGRGDYLCEDETQRTARLESWRVDGVSLAGRWSKEVRVADPFLSDAEATGTFQADEKPEKLVILSGVDDHLVRETSGTEVQQGAPSFDCQGVF